MYVKKRMNSVNSNVIIWFILTPYLNPSSQSLLPSLLSHMTIHPQTNLHSHIKWFDISFTYMVWNIGWKFIFLCLSSDYFLITYLHIFEYELAKSSHIFLPYQLIVHILYILYIHLGFIVPFLRGLRWLRSWKLKMINKDWFSLNFGSDLMYSKISKVWNMVFREKLFELWYLVTH